MVVLWLTAGALGSNIASPALWGLHLQKKQLSWLIQNQICSATQAVNTDRHFRNTYRTKFTKSSWQLLRRYSCKWSLVMNKWNYLYPRSQLGWAMMKWVRVQRETPQTPRDTSLRKGQVLRGRCSQEQRPCLYSIAVTPNLHAASFPDCIA